jgi:hypothetical protein
MKVELLDRSEVTAALEATVLAVSYAVTWNNYPAFLSMFDPASQYRLKILISSV